MATDWTTVSLGEVLEPAGKAIETPRDRDVRFAGVRLRGAGVHEASTSSGAKVKSKTLFPIVPGAFIYNRMWATRGTFAVVPDSASGMFVTNEYPQFVSRDSAINLDFLALLSQDGAFLEQVDAASVGSTERRRLHPTAFLDLEIELPPLREQRAIVAAAEIAGRVVRAWEREAEAAKRTLHAAREELLRAEDEWEELPDGWRTSALGEVAEIRSGITKGRKTRGELIERPFIRAANVQDGFLDLSEIKKLAVSNDECGRFVLARNDVLLIEGGNAEHVGRGWLWEDEVKGAVCQNHVFRARVKSEMIGPRFLAYAVGASPARAYCFESAKKTTNLASINKTQISALRVPVPPLSIQSDIVRKLDKLRETWLRALTAGQIANRVRSALVEDLVTGVRSALPVTTTAP